MTYLSDKEYLLSPTRYDRRRLQTLANVDAFYDYICSYDGIKRLSDDTAGLSDSSRISHNNSLLTERRTELSLTTKVTSSRSA